jgi:hypothetical protein
MLKPEAGSQRDGQKACDSLLRFTLHEIRFTNFQSEARTVIAISFDILLVV